MSREDFLERIRNMDPEEHMATTRIAREKNKRTAQKIDRQRRRRKIANVAKTLGIAEFFSPGGGKASSRQEHDSIGSGHSSVPVTSTSTVTEPSPFSAEEFNVVEAANLMLYLKSIDGKGDHDCGHEH